MKVCAAAILLVLAAVLVASCSRRDTTDDGLGQAAITVRGPEARSAADGGASGAPDESKGKVFVLESAPWAGGEAGGTDPAGRPLPKVQLPGGPGPVAKQGAAVRKAPTGAGVPSAGSGPVRKKMMMTKVQAAP